MAKILFLSLIIITAVQAKLLDKIAGAINDRIVTLSEIERIEKTLPARVEISSMLHASKNMSKDQILDLINRLYIVKDKLESLGIVVNDDSVESSIKDTERRLRVDRAQLLKFLEEKGLSFEEYFEIIRATKEYSIFMQRIIAPLVSVTEQDIKNYYYKHTAGSETLSFKYKLVDFYFSKSEVPDSELNNLPQILTTYQKTGNIPEAYKNVQSNNLGDVSDDDLPKELSSILKATDGGSFSRPYVKDGVVHIFFLRSKDLTESADYLKRKDAIFNELFVQKSQVIVDQWFDKEKSNYYLLNNL